MKVIKLQINVRSHLGGNIELPRQIGGIAKGFRIEKISPTTDRLAQGKGRNHHITELPNRNFMGSSKDNGRHYPPQNGPMNGNTPFPNGKDIPGMLAIGGPLKENIIKASRGNSCHHQPNGQIAN